MERPTRPEWNDDKYKTEADAFGYQNEVDEWGDRVVVYMDEAEGLLRGARDFVPVEYQITIDAFLNSIPSETLREEITPPPGCLLGDGSTLSRETFADLYSAIETWYGEDAKETS